MTVHTNNANQPANEEKSEADNSPNNQADNMPPAASDDLPPIPHRPQLLREQEYIIQHPEHPENKEDPTPENESRPNRRNP